MGKYKKFPNLVLSPYYLGKVYTIIKKKAQNDNIKDKFKVHLTRILKEKEKHSTYVSLSIFQVLIIGLKFIFPRYKNG